MTETGFLLREVARLLTQLQREQVCNCCGTTFTECTILTEIDRAGSVQISELGRRLGVDKGWISRAVDGLVEDGLVAKGSSQMDRRAVVVALTEPGEGKVTELNTRVDDLAERIAARLSPEDREAVDRALALLHGAIQAEMGVIPVEAVS